MEEEAAKDVSEGWGAKLMKVVWVARLEDGAAPRFAVRFTLDMGTTAGALVLSSGPSSSGPYGKGAGKKAIIKILNIKYFKHYDMR